jgi:ferric-dicitrate binding protein FerR (iron transport regulator)
VRGRGGRTQEIEAQAVLRLIALTDNPTPELEAELATWIDLDPAHAVAYARAELAWEEAARLKAGSSTGCAGDAVPAGQSDPGAGAAPDDSWPRAVKGGEQ